MLLTVIIVFSISDYKVWLGFGLIWQSDWFLLTKLILLTIPVANNR